MAIQARVANGYAWRMITIGGVSAVLGMWGVYDYAVKIPRNQELSDRQELLDLCRTALQTEQAPGQLSPEAQEAGAAVDEEITRIIAGEIEKARASGEDPAVTPGEELVIESSQDGAWVKLLFEIKAGLNSPRKLPLTASSYPRAFAAYESTDQVMSEIGEVVTPGKYDRITQWAFILCLPCAPYFFWMYYAARRRRYELQDDGTLVMPEGTWQAHDIASMDMSRWMSKSIATVVHHDGTRVKLDDYKYRNLHLIIGGIAHRLHPDEWDAEAKPVKPEGPPAPEATAAVGADAAAEEGT